MEKISQLKKKIAFSPEKMLRFYQELFAKIKQQKNLNFYTELYEADVYQKIKDQQFWEKYQTKKLFGIPFFLKDNFLVKNKITEGGSKILSGFIASFNATVCQQLEDAGALLLGKTVMDELGLGGTGLESKNGAVINPLQSERIVGGSSSGSAVATQLKLCAFAIGSDTGNSVRAPASYLGVIGYKPTFGLISRYGMIQYSSSLDSVGYFVNHFEDLKVVADVLFGFDQKDFVSQKRPSLPVSFKTLVKIKILVLTVPSDYHSAESKKLFENHFLKKLKNHQIKFVYHQLDETILANLDFIYQIISYSEALSSQAHLTGINYGKSYQKENQNLNYHDLIKLNRTNSFQREIKRRYLLGAFFLKESNQQKFYSQALKARNYLEKYFQTLFKKCDFIVNLATYGAAPLIKDINNWKKQRNFQKDIIDLFVIGNLLGIPSLVFPFTFSHSSKMPLGINFFAPNNQDWALMEFVNHLKKVLEN